MTHVDVVITICPCSNAAPLVVAGFAPGCSCEGPGDLPGSALEDSDAGARQEQRTKTKHLAFGMDQQRLRIKLGCIHIYIYIINFYY